MANNAYKIINNRIHSQGNLVKANRKSIERATLQLQCACPHRDANGAISINPPSGQNAEKSKITGAPLYQCRECYKKLDLSNISQEEFDKALYTICRVIDIGKIRGDYKSEKDRELMQNLSSIEFQLEEILPDVFQTIVKSGNRKKKKGRSGDDNNVRVSR